MKKIVFLFVILFAVSAAGAQRRPVTIFLAGDSTMAPKLPEKRPETGWGEKLEAHFRPGTVTVDNRALNGRSSKSFIAEGKWQELIGAVKKGDHVLIQFGHNDESKDKGERYSTPEEFKANLARFVREVRAKHAYPILLTPVMRRRFDKDGKFYDTHGDYPGYVREVAAELKVMLIDMHRLSEAVIVKYGAEGSKRLFLQLNPGENENYPKGIEDNTHFSPLGAEEMAGMAAQAIAESKTRLRKFLIRKGR